MRPSFLAVRSVNHSAPSAPATIVESPALCVGTLNCVTEPHADVLVTGRRPILLMPASVNQSDPSEAVTIDVGSALAGSVQGPPTMPFCETFQIACVPGSVTHMLPSDPSVMLVGRAALESKNS